MKKEKYFSIEAGSEQNNYELLSVSLAAYLSHHAKYKGGGRIDTKKCTKNTRERNMKYVLRVTSESEYVQNLAHT